MEAVQAKQFTETQSGKEKDASVKLFVGVSISTFYAVLYNLVYSFMRRLRVCTSCY